MVDGQLQGVAGFAFLPAQFAHDAAHGIDFDPLGACLPAQLGFGLGLDPGFADLEFRDLQQRIGVFQFGQVIIRDRPDITDHMGEIALHGVMAA